MLRKQAAALLDMLKGSIASMLEKGIKYGQLKPNIQKEYYASVIIAMLEGAVMMSKLKGNNEDIRIAVRHLESILKEIEI